MDWSGVGAIAGSAGRRSLPAGQMAQAIDEHLDRMAWLDEVDRRNSCYRRHQLSELGDIELAVLRNPAICANWCGTPMLAPRAGRPDGHGVLCPWVICARSARHWCQSSGSPSAPPASAQWPSSSMRCWPPFMRGHARIDTRADARWRGAGPQDGRRRHSAARAGRLCPPERRQEGSHRFSTGTGESAAEWERFLGDLIGRAWSTRGSRMRSRWPLRQVARSLCAYNVRR